MKKLIQYHSILASILVVIIGCSKDIVDRSEQFPALAPVQTDTNAGRWKPILLSAADAITINTPLATTHPNYVLELNEIKSYQANLTAEQRATIQYWSAGAVLRWNEILRTLIAKRNLPPYQNADGTYPFPNANNPLAYPVFPFANPPYAARAYAYVAAAQYDALVAAYYYKNQYRRDAPYKVDRAIQLLVPEQTDVYSYPSEDAVVLGATLAVLQLLFPADGAYLQEKANEHRNYRIMAGANTRSDIEAGEALGRAVAQLYITRAGTDRAGAAAGNATIWQQFETDAINRNETPWISLESPRRPPMLPLFGKVRGFFIDSATMVSLRPAPPPSVHSAQFKTELAEVLHFSKNATREQIRIAHFWADGVGTYTPPGHWNAIAAEAFVPKRFSEVRWARNMALLNIAMFEGAINCWDTKYTYFNPRPSQIDPTIKSVTGVPNFPAYTSGHSTFSAAAATVLTYLLPEQANNWNAMAKEASLSRLYGAIHYRSDCEVGLQCGNRVGSYAVARGRIDGAN
ncbi:MAG: phosphatase PAP2 family protein [Chitinophagaceae bacterium]